MAPKVDPKAAPEPPSAEEAPAEAEEAAEESIPPEKQPWDEWDHFYKATKQDKEMWAKLSVHELGIIFTLGPIELLHRAWERLDRGDVKYLMEANIDDGTLTYWDPFILKDEGKRLYHSYSPVVLDMKSEQFRVLAFRPPLHNRKQTPGCWYAMPSLNFLPVGIKKVIAGDGGLLVCDGAMQWTAVLIDGQLTPLSMRSPVIPGGRPLPMDPEVWTRHIYLGGQTIQLVCNPITREFMFLPPFHKTMTLNAKAACIRYMDFAEFVPLPPTPPPESEVAEPGEGDELAADLDVGHSIDEIVSRASRRGTLVERRLSRRMSVPHADVPSRRASIHADLDDELDELDFEAEMQSGRGPSRRRSSTHASEEVFMPEEVEKIIEGRFQRIWRLYFECFGRIPVPEPPPSRHYIIVVMGYRFETKFDAFEENKLVCCVYRSTEQEKWSYIREVPCLARTMPNEIGRTGLAMLTTLADKEWMAVCFGALVLGDIKEILQNQEEDQSRKTTQNDFDTSSETSSRTSCNSDCSRKGDDSDERITAAVFYVSVVPTDDTALVFPFKPAGYEEDNLTCPIVLQPFGVKSPEIIVAVTRKPYGADRMLVFQVEMEQEEELGADVRKPRPTGSFSWITETPTFLYRDLFYTPEVSNKPFECSAGNGLICIKSTDGQRLAIYDMYTARWWLEDFHKYMPCRRKEKPFQLLEISSWEPNFRQRVEYDSRYVGGKPDPVAEEKEDDKPAEAVKEEPKKDVKKKK